MKLRDNESGQALVEFSLAIMVFLFLGMAILDFGRGIYVYNGVSQAAREIARAASVHPYAPGSKVLGTSTEVQGVIATQKKLIPGLATPTFTCIQLDGTTYTGTCDSDYQIKVLVQAPFGAVTPLMSLLPSYTMQSTSTVQIQ